MKSRHFTLVDVPEPTNLKTEFVYNFFAPDERVNESGDKRVRGVKNETLQKMVDYSSLLFEVPRFVEISFSQVETFGNNFGDAKNQIEKNLANIGKANSEETVTNIGFVALRETDDDAIPRLKEKIDALSKALGVGFEDANQSKKIAETLKVNQDDIQSIISPYNDPKFLVNEKKNAGPQSSFLLASNSRIISQVNKRLAGACINSADDCSPLSKFEIVSTADKISKDFISFAKQFSLAEEDVEPLIEPVFLQQTNEKKKLLSISSIGYILTRCRFGDDGRKKQVKTFFLPGSQNTKYLDTEVAYGATYSYDVRAVYQVDAILNGNVQFDLGEDSGEKTNWRTSFLLSSRACNSSRVRTEEFQPPKEPDGVFYDFNYEKQEGLTIRWQIPSGRSGDTKYFQIFRRKSIFEPFVCIAMLDFDDSQLRTLPPEQVRQERIYTFSRAKTTYEDGDFTRNSRYIYAVAAIDAHGLSSGYSTQTEVSFDRVKNSLSLKLISPGGAPKQYPNFYVDPDLDDNIAVDSFTQDAIFDSGHKTITVYFTPDARISKTSTGDIENVFYTDTQQGSYSFYMINLDVQKSNTATIDIKDLRKTT